LPLINPTDMSSRFSPDLHHPFHPRKSEDLQDIGGQALRNCRVQRIHYETHHHYYHGAFFGPELPQDDAGKFRLVVLAAAGYVPDQGIVFNARRKPLVVPIDDKLRSQITQPNKLYTPDRKGVQKFLLEYTLAQDLAGVNEYTIDEFLHTASARRRQELGDTLLGEAAYRATEPIRKIYREAHRAALIPPDKARVASRFVLLSLTTRRNREAVHKKLEARLAA
jgi:hypothetical protein